MTTKERWSTAGGGDHLVPVGRDQAGSEDRHRPFRPVERVGA
jgi:hypothetical protein